MKNKKIPSLITFCLSIILLTGVVLGYYFPFFLFFFFISVVSLIFIYIFYKKSRLFLSDICIALLILSLGAAWAISFSLEPADVFLRKESFYKLKVISLPIEQHLRGRFWAQITEIDGIAVSQKVKVSDYTNQMQYLCSYKVRGKLSKHKLKDRRFYYLWVKKGVSLEELPINLWDKFNKKTTEQFISFFKDNVGEKGYRFLSSVFLGRVELLTYNEKASFAGCGGSHLLAISGLHLGLTSLFVFFMLRFFNINFRTRLIISMLFLYVYTVLTGASSSTSRSMIMYSVFGFSFFMKRKVNSLNSLGLAGIILVLINPLSLFGIGFQLSFLSVFAILLGTKLFPIKASSNTVINYIKQILYCSLCVTSFITPLVSYYFDRIYLLSIFYNIILIPFFTLILMINFIFIIFSPVTFIAQSLGSVLNFLIFWFISFIQFSSNIKGSFFSYTFSIKGVFFYYMALAVFLVVCHRWKKSRLKGGIVV